MQPVTDPALLAQLNGGDSGGLKPVTDPDLLKQLEPPAPSPWYSDLVKSVPSALLKMASGHASALGSAASIEMGQDASEIPDAKTTQDIVEKNVTGPLYRPQTKAGEIGSNAVATMLDPMTLTTGAFGPLRAALGAGAASVASDVAGEATKGTPYELPARIAAGFLSPAFAPKKLGIPAPSSEASKAAGGAGYDAFRSSDLELAVDPFKQWAAKEKDRLLQGGTDDVGAPRTFKALDDIINRPAPKQTTPDTILAGDGFHIANDVPVQDTLNAPALTAMRDRFKNIAYDGNAPESAAKTIASSFDKQLLGTAPNNVVKGDLPAMLSAYKDARDNYGAGLRSDELQFATKKAEASAAVANSGKNAGNAYKAAFKPIYLQPEKFGNFNAPEVDALKGAVFGSQKLNLYRNIGNRLGGGGGLGQTGLMLLGSGLGGAAGYAADGSQGASEGGLVGPALAVLGSLSRNRYNKGMAARVQAVDELTRSRSPLAKAAMAGNPSSNVSSPAMRFIHALEALRSAQQP